MKEKLAIKDIAEQCMVSNSTVRRWIKDGKLSAFKLPSHHYRIRYADYEDFLKRYDIRIEENP
jgi:excisionase family DNA binding protein